MDQYFASLVLCDMNHPVAPAQQQQQQKKKEWEN